MLRLLEQLSKQGNVVRRIDSAIHVCIVVRLSISLCAPDVVYCMLSYFLLRHRLLITLKKTSDAIAIPVHSKDRTYLNSKLCYCIYICTVSFFAFVCLPKTALLQYAFWCNCEQELISVSTRRAIFYMDWVLSPAYLSQYIIITHTYRYDFAA